MKENFPNPCLPVVLRFEGGYSNDAHDPGGATLNGVIQTVYSAYRRSKGQAVQPVSRMTAAERDDIYRTRFWDAVKGDGLPSGIDMAVFDAGVNSGPARALKWLHASWRRTPAETIRAFSGRRLGFVRSLRIFTYFGKGWSARIAAVEARALRMAAEALSPPASPGGLFAPRPPAPAIVAARLRNHAQSSLARLDDARTAGHVASGGGVAAAAGGGFSGLPWEAALALLAAAGVLAACCYARSAFEHARASAIVEEASAVLQPAVPAVAP
jgi:lysozyme family protein